MTRSFACLLAPVVLAACAADPSSPVGSRSAAIVGGTTDTGDPAVVLVIAYDPNNQNAGYSMCTGEVLSPHVVLTAAHCVDPDVIGTGQAFTVFTAYDFNDNTLANDQSNYVDVAETHYDTQFDVNDLQGGHDVGIVLTKTAIAVTPLPYNRTALPSSATGATVRLVGYGVSSGTDQNGTTAGTKRQTSTTLTQFDAMFLDFTDPKHETCEGDSGGPALMKLGGVETIIGTTSFGDQGCRQGGVDTRIDAYASFVDPFVEADTGSVASSDMASGAVDMGSSSVSDLATTQAPDLAQAQQNPDMAQPQQQDNPDLAQPVTGANATGAPCSSNGDCQSGLCFTTGATSYCTQGCDPKVANACPTGMRCAGVSPDTYCELVPAATQVAGGKTAGCSLGGDGAEPFGPLALAVALVAAAGLSRRRKATR